MHRAIAKTLAALSFVAAIYCLVWIMAQAMLSGASPEDVWRARWLAWLLFLATGLLLLLSAYLWRRDSDSGSMSLRSAVMFALGHFVLTAVLFVLDRATY